MRKSFLFVMIGLLMVGVSGNVWAVGVIAADLECTNPAGCIQTSEISNGAVTDAQISGTISGSKLGTHTHSGSDIIDGTISTSKIVDGAVTTSKLADWSVNEAKIIDFSVTNSKISSNAVTTEKIVDGAVTDAKISGPISASKLAGSIGVENLGVYAGTKIVHKGAVDNVNTFNTIGAAIQAIGSNSADRYAVVIMPGIYEEDFSFFNAYVRYNIDMIGQSRMGTIIRPLNDNNWAHYIMRLADGLVVKNVTIEGAVDISSSNEVSLIDSTIKTNSSAYGIVSHYPTNVIMENITIEVADSSTGMWLYSYYRDRNIKLNNITLKLAPHAVGIWVYPVWDDDHPVKLSNITIDGDSTSFGMRFFSYDSGVVELDNMSVTGAGSAFGWNGGVVKVKATNCKFNNTLQLVEDNSYNLTVNIDNSIINSPITSTVTPVKIAGSKITRPITSSNSQVKIINSYDGNYDPILNGLY